MAYTIENFATKKALKEAVSSGKTVRLQDGLFAPAKVNGTEYVEGPHYPKPHSWYAQVTMRDGKVVAVK